MQGDHRTQPQDVADSNYHGQGADPGKNAPDQAVALARSSLDGIAEELLRLSNTGLPLDEPTIAATRFRNLTADEVRLAFLRWIRPNDLAQVTLGPGSK